MMISVEAINKFIDLSQLTNDIEGGTFPYDHVQWIEMRLALEGKQHVFYWIAFCLPQHVFKGLFSHEMIFQLLQSFLISPKR